MSTWQNAHLYFNAAYVLYHFASRPIDLKAVKTVVLLFLRYSIHAWFTQGASLFLGRVSSKRVVCSHWLHRLSFKVSPPADWPRWATLPRWGSTPPSNQIQTSVPSREETSGSLSSAYHSNVSTLETAPANNAFSVKQNDSFVILPGFFRLWRGPLSRHNDSSVAAFVGRFGRSCTGRVHCVFARAIWRWGWGSFFFLYNFIYYT